MTNNKISNGYEDIKVDVVDYVKDIAKHAWDCYKMTWSDLQDVEYDVNNPKVQEAVRNIMFYRALPMPREQANITFKISNVSRVMLAQITRQSLGRFNVESQMPKPVNHNVILPLNIATNDKLSDKARKLIELSQEVYDECIAEGIPPQDARYLLMHGQTTSLAYVANVNVFTSAFAMRCENNLSDEINLVYRLCKKAILDKVEDDYKSGEIDKLTYEFYTKIIRPADALGAARKVGQNYDSVFGNSFKRYPDANDEITKITEHCSYDYTKSAWYLELQRMPKELLFDGEQEMIDSWK